MLAEDVLKRRKEDLVLIKLKYNAGRESSPAVKEAEASLLQAEYDKKQAEEELILAQIELNLLLGRSPSGSAAASPGGAHVDAQHAADLQSRSTSLSALSHWAQIGSSVIGPRVRLRT